MGAQAHTLHTHTHSPLSFAKNGLMRSFQMKCRNPVIIRRQPGVPPFYQLAKERLCKQKLATRRMQPCVLSHASLHDITTKSRANLRPVTFLTGSQKSKNSLVCTTVHLHTVGSPCLSDDSGPPARRRSVVDQSGHFLILVFSFLVIYYYIIFLALFSIHF